MTINDLCKHAHEAAMDKGWYDKERELPELLMLTVSELSECLEADRNNKWCKISIGSLYALPEGDSFKENVKDTVEDEISDAFIRLADLCGYYGIDIESHIRAKMAYNETRPNKHGKAY